MSATKRTVKNPKYAKTLNPKNTRNPATSLHPSSFRRRRGATQLRLRSLAPELAWGFEGLGLGVWSLGFWGLGFGVWGLELKGLEFRVWGFGVWSLGFRGWGSVEARAASLNP